MPKQAIKVEVNTFVQGLITEASELNFPPNASFDEDNFELSRTGSRKRRLGIDLEDNFDYFYDGSELDLESTPVTFKWFTVDGVPGLNFLVVQITNKLFFFDSSKEFLSSTGYVGTIVLTDFPSNIKYSITSVAGTLVVTAGTDKICVVKYNSVDDTFSQTYSSLITRDLWGVQTIDAVETNPNYRPLTGEVGFEHIYNLRNQSWGVPRKDKDGTLQDPIGYFTFSATRSGGLFSGNQYPSNSETVWPAMQFQPILNGESFERMYGNLWNDARGSGDVISAKGYFFIDPLRRGQSRIQSYLNNRILYPTIGPVGTLKTDYTPGGPTVVTEFAGRVFYSGFSGQVIDGDSHSPNLSNYVFFSQLVRGQNDFVKCYQEGDPTSRDNNDLVETDGGFLRISGAEIITGMINIGSSLIVMATNGVWAITGGSDYGFSATNYKVDKISTFGCISQQSIIEDQGRAFYWSENGIYVIAKDQFGTLGSQSLTETTIQSFYQKIPTIAKQNAIGVYDPINKKIKWVYQEGTRFNSTSLNRELGFDLTLNAFSTNTFMNLSTNNVEIVSTFAVDSFLSNAFADQVYAGVDQVLALTDDVVIEGLQIRSGIQTVKYLCAIKDGSQIRFTFAELSNSQFLDWESVDGTGIDAKAFLITGSQTAGISSIHKQIPYLVMHFIRTETTVDTELDPLNQSGCLIRTQWDWAKNSLSMKWSALKQAYRYTILPRDLSPGDDYDNGFTLITTKNKVRGRGRSFALYMETEPLKDCQIVGWSMTVNGNAFV